MELDDPTGYGRVVRRDDGSVERVVETKVEGDATDEQLAIREVNAGVYAFDGGRAQGRPRAPDARQRPGRALPALDARAARPRAAHRLDDPTLLLGVNDRADLARVRALAQARIHRALMRAGVTIVDPASTLSTSRSRSAPTR